MKTAPVFHYGGPFAACICDDWQSCADDLAAGSRDVLADFDRYALYLDSERRAGRLLPGVLS